MELHFEVSVKIFEHISSYRLGIPRIFNGPIFLQSAIYNALPIDFNYDTLRMQSAANELLHTSFLSSLLLLQGERVTWVVKLFISLQIEFEKLM